MDLSNLTQVADISITLAVVVCFLVYMWVKNGKNEKAFRELSKSIDNNSVAMHRNSDILARHLEETDGNHYDIDKLRRRKSDFTN